MALLMSRMPEAAPYAFAAVTAVAAVTDFWKGKIYNWLTLPAILAALALAAVSGKAVFGAACLGLLTGVALFLPLFAFGVLGGGDVKLLLALAALFGAEGALELGGACLLVAALGAFGLLVLHGRVRHFFGEIYRFLRSFFVAGLTLHWPRLSRDIKAPFGIAIFVGYMLLWGKA